MVENSKMLMNNKEYFIVMVIFRGIELFRLDFCFVFFFDWGLNCFKEFFCFVFFLFVYLEFLGGKYILLFNGGGEGGIGGWGGKNFLKFVINWCGLLKVVMLFWFLSLCFWGFGLGFLGWLSFGMRFSYSDNFFFL